MLMRLAFAILAVSAAAAAAQPAVPPLPGAAPAAPMADAPPTSAPAAGAPQAAPPPLAADAPPTSDAPTSAPPTQTATATPNTPPSNITPEAPATPAVPPTVTKNYPLTPDGNARFLADYAARSDVKKLDDGVLYRVLRPAEAKSNGPLVRSDTVTVSYRGWLIDGTAFDQTKPGIPALFRLSAVISGWRTALMKMKVGDLWEVAIPADEAYGAEGAPGRVPPNQTLIFVISLAKVEYAG